MVPSPAVIVDVAFLCWRIGEAIAVGFQHYILALGTAVMIPTFLVPLMGGSDVRFSFTMTRNVVFTLLVGYMEVLIFWGLCWLFREIK